MVKKYLWQQDEEVDMVMPTFVALLVKLQLLQSCEIFLKKKTYFWSSSLSQMYELSEYQALENQRSSQNSQM